MLTDPPPWLHEIDHTGDVGLQVTADTMEQLFERAAAGMFHVITDPADVRVDTEMTITVQGRDREALLVHWLTELNYRHTVDRQLYSTFVVKDITTSEEELLLTATVGGEPTDPARHTVHTEIKAVTFHGLDVDQTSDGWTAQVIFDM